MIDESPNKPEPPPTPNNSPPIWDLVVEDMRERDRDGRRKYGTPLQANNGRNPLVDAYQESLDLTVYLRQALAEQEGPQQIFLDMDGVLADWTAATCRLFGRDPEAVYSAWPAAWDIAPALGVSGKELWRRVDAAGFEFWAGLDAYPWADGLLELCRSVAPTTILTSPSWDPQSLAGKLAWMQARWGADFRDYLVGPDKLSCARPGALVIDDRPETVSGFIKRGGDGVLFPAPWNSNRNLDPMAHVRDRLGRAHSLLTLTSEGLAVTGDVPFQARPGRPCLLDACPKNEVRVCGASAGDEPKGQFAPFLPLCPDSVEIDS